MKKTLFTLLSALLAMCFTTLAFTACGQVTVTISQTEASILVGETLALTATASDESEIVWETSDEEIATVKSNGSVRGIKEGTVTITAKTEKASATCEVTVSSVTVTLDKATATVELGETVTLSATSSDNGAITWSSSNNGVATVDANGVVTAVAEGTSTITAKRGAAGSASCEVTVIWSDKPADYKVLVNGAESDTANNLNDFVYWNDQGWCGSNVTVTKAEYANGAATISYTGATTACWFGLQVFYKNEANVPGKDYKLECTITSEVEGDITVCGTVVSIKAGVNNIVVYYTEAEFNYTGTEPAASLTLQMGAEAAGTVISENTFSISNLTFTEYSPEKLTAPTAVSISSEKVVTITDSTGGKASAYNLQFYAGETLKYQLTVQNGDTLDTSTMESGTYNVKATSVGTGIYTTSDASEVLTTFSVTNGSVEYNLENKGEDTSIGKYYYWSEWNAIKDAKYVNGVITFSIEDAGGNWYSNQFFYKDSSLAEGASYTISLKINVTAACKVTINGTVVDLVAGDNTVTVNATQSAKATFSMQLGTVEGGANGVAATYTLSDITYTAK